MRLEARNGQSILTVDDWFRLAPPMGGSLQWRDGRSAKELAKAWCHEGEGPEAPSELLALFAAHPMFHQLVLDGAVAYPERRVRFDLARGEPRNTDLALACESIGGLVAISVEAKADESFGRTVGEEIMSAAAQWAFAEQRGKLERIQGLVEAILPKWRPGRTEIGQLRYQLLTATAGAWAFAKEVGASRAVLVVHEFVGPRTNQGRLGVNRSDLDRFANRVTEGRVQGLGDHGLIGPLPVPRSEFWPGVDEWYLGKCKRTLPDLDEARQ